MKFRSAAIAVALLAAAPASAATMIYNVNPATECSKAARDVANLRSGMAYCDEALSDPIMIHRGALLIDRGILKFAAHDAQGALADFNSGLAENPQLGDGYINRAALLVSLKRSDEARADVDKAIQLGAGNMHVAYYTRAVIEDDAGNYAAAYRDYRQALALKPDFAPATRELTRFKVTPNVASSAVTR